MGKGRVKCPSCRGNKSQYTAIRVAQKLKKTKRFGFETQKGGGGIRIRKRMKLFTTGFIVLKVIFDSEILNFLSKTWSSRNTVKQNVGSDEHMHAMSVL